MMRVLWIFPIILLAQAPATAVTLRSMSNKADEVEVIGEDQLFVQVHTGIYETKTSGAQCCFNEVCSNDRAVIIRLDPTTPDGDVELALMKQIIETAAIGPYRIRFRIVQDECAQVLGRSDTFPVATGVEVLQEKPE